MINMKAYRELKGLQQKDIANETGLSKASISIYESGKGKPSINSAFKIARALGVTIDDLYSIDKSPEIHKKEVKQNA